MWARVDPLCQAGCVGQGAVWVVSGPPGAGKSKVADLLSEWLSPAPALLDKDTLFAGFVREVQRAHGRDLGEREGPWYDAHVKLHEYAGMTAAAAQMRQSGVPVLLVGPFTTQVRDPDGWEQWVAALGGPPVHLVWVGCAASALRQRLVDRGRPGDRGKLEDWEAFVARVRPDEPPATRHTGIDNSGTLADLHRAVAAVVAQPGCGA